MWCSPDSALSIFSHNDVYNATASPYQGCLDPTGTNGNISAEPNFFATPLDFDYRLRAGSPAIDAGDSAAPSISATDHFGAPRITDGNGDRLAVVDMGAIENPAVPGGRYHPLTPARILDTRSGLGAPVAKLGPASTLGVQVTGRGGVPADRVSAVVLNVTVTQPTTETFITVFPSGTVRPLASNLNVLAGQTAPNLVSAKVGTDGKVAVYNNAGSAHIVIDVVGWYGAAFSTAGARFHVLPPARILDTRNNTGGFASPLAGGSTISPAVTGVGGVPASGVSAVVLNVTATQPTAETFLTVFPSGTGRPVASNLNVVPGKTVPNLVIAKVGADGKLSVYNNAGTTHVVFDVVGMFGADGAPTGSLFHPLPPARVLDTRTGIGGFVSPAGAAGTISVTVAGVGGVPATGVSAVVLNATVTQPKAESFLTVFPSGTIRPLASNLNFVPSQTVPNLVVAKVGADGKVSVYNNAGTSHVIFDVVGWYSG